jgi:hypothetical protein
VGTVDGYAESAERERLESAMQYTVDDRLVAEARRVLKTSSPEEAIEASLRRAILAGSEGALTERHRPRDEGEWEALRRRLRQKPSEHELMRRRAAGEAMDRLRVRVGRDFNPAEVVGEVREGAAG